MNRYQNCTLSPEERADDLLGQMSLEEKMGQVVCYMPATLGEYGELEANYPQGAGQVSCLEMRDLDSLEAAAQLQRDVQERIMAAGEHHIPAIFHMEGLCGAFIQGAVSFPAGIGRGAAWDPGLEEKVGEVVGRQERAVGITHTFAPVLDISRDSRMGRQGETYGEDPALTAALGCAYLKGLQKDQTDGRRSEGVAKHYMGFHASEGGIHGTGCDISPRQLREIYGKPFQAAIREGGLKGVMPCYNSINGEPVSASEEILTNILREEMGFQGVTVSDYCAVMNIHEVQKVCETDTEAGLRAMAAGLDMELHFKKCFNEELAGWFATGKADIAILDRAVRRVLEAKFRMGLFENPFALSGERLGAEFNKPGDREVTLKSARESLVLLKNNGVLPIAATVQKIALIGYHAGTAKIFYGGYTHFSMAEGKAAAVSTMAGLQTAREDKDESKPEIKTIPGTKIQDDQPIFEEILKKQNPAVKSLLNQLRTSMPEREITYARGYHFAGNDMSGHDEALELALEADMVILTLGGKHGTSSIASMGEGIDTTDINLPVCQEEFLKKLAAVNRRNVPIAVIHFNGRPLSSDAADQYADAILEAWSPGEMGAEAIVDVLTGNYNPGGKLPVSVPYHAGQIPVYYNHSQGSQYHQGESIAFAEYVDMPHAPRYFFGYGLSYTDFRYCELVLDQKEISPEGEIGITVVIENIGDRSGDEVVQLYIRDRFASMTRPCLELAGFRRLTLAAGERRRILFKMRMSQMAFMDRDMRWKIEAGEIEVMAGSSSRDIRLTDSFLLKSDLFIEGRNRGFFATSELVD